jgi:hypothetical protein
VNYPENTLCIVGNSQSQQHNPITRLYGHFFMVFIVEATTGRIIDVGGNFIMPITESFIKDIFTKENIKTDPEVINMKICSRYLGSSQKAILVAFKDAQKKYINHINGKPIKE